MENKLEKFEVDLFNGWVKGKVYTDVADSPSKYREFCAIVKFTPDKGEEKTYLPYCNNREVSFKFTDVKVGDVLYLGYTNQKKRRTVAREYCKVIEKTSESATLMCGFRGYVSASEYNIDTNKISENEEV